MIVVVRCGVPVKNTLKVTCQRSRVTEWIQEFHCWEIIWNDYIESIYIRFSANKPNGANRRQANTFLTSGGKVRGESGFVCFASVQKLDVSSATKKCFCSRFQHSLSLLPFSLLPRRLHQQFESYKEQVRKIGEEARRYQGEHKDDAPTCGICHKTKFADGCGHLCSYCSTKFCARCGGRVSLRSNNVSRAAHGAHRWMRPASPVTRAGDERCR